MALRSISFTIFAQRKSLLLSTSSAVQISQVLHSFFCLGGRRSATCNETVVLLSGEGDDLGMIFNVAIGCDGDLTAFDMCKLDAFRIQLPLDDLSLRAYRLGS